MTKEFYIIKTWLKNGIFAGLFKVNGREGWDDLGEASEKYGWAVECGDMGGVSLIMVREKSVTIIKRWRHTEFDYEYEFYIE